MKRLILIIALVLGAAVGTAKADEKIIPAEVVVNGLVYPINSTWTFSLFVDSQHVTNDGTFETALPFIKTADGTYRALTVCGDDLGIPCVPTALPKGALGEVHQGEQIPLEGEGS